MWLANTGQDDHTPIGSESTSATLGMMVPDNQANGPLDYELYRPGPWLEPAGVDVVIDTEDSPPPGVEVARAPACSS